MPRPLLARRTRTARAPARMSARERAQPYRRVRVCSNARFTFPKRDLPDLRLRRLQAPPWSAASLIPLRHRGFTRILRIGLRLSRPESAAEPTGVEDVRRIRRRTPFHGRSSLRPLCSRHSWVAAGTGNGDYDTLAA